MILSDNKIAHCKAVAEYMYNNAVHYGVSPDEAYFIGLNHDIGYLFGSEDHSTTGYCLLSRLGIMPDIANVIRFHGTEPESVIEALGDIPPLLHLLYKADMTIMADGTHVSYITRLNDIHNRYGSNSSQYKSALKIVAWLKKNEV